MPIIIFCEFANWGNPPRWCSGCWSTRWSRSTRWRMKSVPGFFSTQFIISAMAGWRRRKFLKGESSRQHYLVLANGRSWNQIFDRDGSLEKVPHWAGWRRVHVAILVFFGLITNFMLRVNIMYAIEYMYMWVIFLICLASSQNTNHGITRQIIIIIILITMTIITITILSTEGERRVKRLSSLLFSLAMSLCRFYMMPFMTSRRYKDGCRWWCLLLCYLCIIKPDDPRCLAVVLPRCLEQNEFLAFARKLILTFLQYLLKSDHWTFVCFVYLQLCNLAPVLGINLSFDHLELNVSFYICSVSFPK